MKTINRKQWFPSPRPSFLDFIFLLPPYLHRGVLRNRYPEIYLQYFPGTWTSKTRDVQATGPFSVAVIFPHSILNILDKREILGHVGRFKMGRSLNARAGGGGVSEGFGTEIDLGSFRVEYSASWKRQIRHFIGQKTGK
ncbi:hypothetical protein GWI33_017134 [Rhynchophorus ferrugineus]|uniref:Uncharacterized protein n=1 Tax=Rhynchophorus ferrugineus TaxID=354439 RepID=A0A834HWJ9_RHYFE|nr:hypothetical protein GWI33_017134 [Rhynchophorus ferrugineus]